jgi:hypothetical protein
MKPYMHHALILISVLITISPLTSLADTDVGAIVLEFNTSVRAEGMGGAGVAQHWGGDPNLWANPANIAYQQGFRYTSMESRLTPDLTADIYLKDDWIALGIGGIGLYYSATPFDGSRIEFNDQPTTNDAGIDTGSSSSWMKAKRYGVGVSIGRVLEILDPQRGSDISRYFDVSAGYVHIDYEKQLADDPVMQDQGGHGEGSARSYGLLAQITPINTINRSNTASPFGGYRLTLAYGLSVLNKSSDVITTESKEYLFPTSYLNGWSIHLETGLPTAWSEAFETSHREWLIDALTPLISFGYASQTIEPGTIGSTLAHDFVYEHDTTGLRDEESSGWELSVANILSIRSGRRTGPGQIDGSTSGKSLGFKFGSRGGVRWDTVTVPQATGLSDVDRESWTAWVNLKKW